MLPRVACLDLPSIESAILPRNTHSYMVKQVKQSLHFDLSHAHVASWSTGVVFSLEPELRENCCLSAFACCCFTLLQVSFFPPSV